ncbi:hypothetical protein Hypma_004951 [Hypsizygus marmoreus]|uniref:Uncharacterized protein n=1 Tax=Hypsizygus marmoreus TaxID=39966 RepID=A0A369K7R3_HYPMA|nr:hypothetical protein Hypma_004951 [Hypsizygus marmoreus]
MLLDELNASSVPRNAAYIKMGNTGEPARDNLTRDTKSVLAPIARRRRSRSPVSSDDDEEQAMLRLRTTLTTHERHNVYFRATYCDNEGMQDADRRVQQAILQRQGTTTSFCAYCLLRRPRLILKLRSFKTTSVHDSCLCFTTRRVDEGMLGVHKTAEIDYDRPVVTDISIVLSLLRDLYKQCGRYTESLKSQGTGIKFSIAKTASLRTGSTASGRFVEHQVPSK